MSQTNKAVSPRRIALAALAAFLTALLLFVTAVVPAEYGIDPLGTGQLFGLLALAQVPAITTESSEYRLDAAELELAPSEWVEYTYRLEQGGSMLYSWQATGPLSYNFHSAPDGAPPGYAESFDAKESDHAHGSYMAPFIGVHGWYWENHGTDYVTITLSTAGFYSDAHEARDRVDGFHRLTDLRGNKIDHVR